MKQVDFENGKITRNIFQTMGPLLVAQLLNLLYNIVDRVYIGRIPGEGTGALGGVGLCFPIIILITGFTNMYGMGGSPLFSIELGKGDRENADRIMNTAFRLICVTAAAIMVFGQLIAVPMLHALGASDNIMDYSLVYLRIYLLGTLFSMIATGMNPYINAQGFPRIGMMSVVIGAISNLILDPIFIFKMNLGVSGAAIATVISQGLSAAFVIYLICGGKLDFRIHFEKKQIVKEYFPFAGEIISLGTAPFIMQCTNSLVQMACNSVLLTFGGEIYVSVMTIVSSVRQLLDTPILAATEGASPVISYNYGAGKASNVRKGIFIMTGSVVLYTIVIWALIEWRPAMLISIFSSDHTILEDAVPALHLYFFAFPFQALQMSGQTVFKAMGKKKRNIFFSLFRKVILVVPLTFTLPYLWGLGTNGVFMAEPISNFVGGLACYITMLLTILPEIKKFENNKKHCPSVANY